MRLRYVVLMCLSTLPVAMPVGWVIGSAIGDALYTPSYEAAFPTLPGPVDDNGVLLPENVDPTAEKRQFKLDRIEKLGIRCDDFYSDHNILILEPGTDLANPSTTDPALDGYLSMAQEIDYCAIPEAR